MGGWTFNYPFTLYNTSFSLFQWHEIEFARAKEFYLDDGVAIGDGASHGVNGALSAWWHMTQGLKTGIEYRYASNKLGNKTYQSAYVYTLGYSF